MQSRFVIPGAIVLFGLIIGVALFVSMRPAEREDGAIGDPSGMRDVSDADHILGNPSAPIVFVQYADPDCAYCSFLTRALAEVMGKYGNTGEVAWVYRHLPLPASSPSSVEPSVALECSAMVGGEGDFFRFLTAFGEVTAGTGTDRIVMAARQVGLPEQAFLDCAGGEEAKANVAADAKDALLAGATGVPYTILLVKDRPPVPISGTVSVEQLTQIIEAARRGQQ